MNIYLAGGMRNCWADRVITSAPGNAFIDPRDCTSKEEREYTEWDLAQVRACDLLLAYMDNDNPSGFGLCVEVGYAAALGKPIWYVCEDAQPRQKYFGMVRSCAERVFGSIDEAIAALNAGRGQQ